ncbi:MAG: threonine/serine dehydratase [Gemmatimonadaceae bacterium]
MTLSASITVDDVHAARVRLAPYLQPSPVRHYPLLDEIVGHGIRVLVKHENHNPVNSFKVRNGLSAVTALEPDVAARGVIAASTGNHGQGVAFAGHQLGVPVTICVPIGNNPEKNAAIRALGATLVETGNSYDECAINCGALAEKHGFTILHSTNNRAVLAGAGTLSLELLEQAPDVSAMVIAVGGGSQVVGALVVANALKPSLRVYGAQSVEAPAQYESWKAKARLAPIPSRTFAEGIATAVAYDLTFDTLVTGLSDFVLVPDAAIAQSVRDLWRITHNLVEGSGAAGLAGLRALAPSLAGQTVGIVLSGGNLDTATAVQVLSGAR